MADEGNLTRAAQGLGLRSPSLSQQIRALEQELRAELFDRSAAGMALTAAGRALLPEARVVLAAAERGVRAVAAAAAEPLLSVGIAPGAAEDLPTRIVGAARHAGAVVEFRDLSSAAQLPLLRRGVLDAGVVSLPIEGQDLTVAVISDEPLGVLLSVRHRLAANASIEWADLVGERLLWFRRDLAPGYHDQVLRVCHDHGWHPAVRVSTARRSVTLAELSGSEPCVALRPERDADPARSLMWRPLASDAPRLRLALAFPSDTRHLALARIATDLNP